MVVTMSFFEIDNDSAHKILFYSMPFVTYIIALFSGLWWLSDDLISGVIFLCGLYVLAYHTGYKSFYNSARLYFYITYGVPVVLGSFLFILGFFVVV